MVKETVLMKAASAEEAAMLEEKDQYWHPSQRAVGSYPVVAKMEKRRISY